MPGTGRFLRPHISQDACIGACEILVRLKTRPQDVKAAPTASASGCFHSHSASLFLVWDLLSSSLGLVASSRPATPSRVCPFTSQAVSIISTLTLDALYLQLWEITLKLLFLLLSSSFSGSLF